MVAVGAVRLLELCNERMPAGGEQLEVDVQLRGHLVPAINHLRERGFNSDSDLEVQCHVPDTQR